MSCFAFKKPLHPAKKVWIRLTAAVHKLRRSKPVATILPVRPSEPLFHVQHGKSHKRFHARKSSHQQSFAPVYIDELFSRDATIHVEGEKTMRSESTFVRTSSSREGEVGGKMKKSERAAVGTSSSKEGEKTCEKITKSEWTAVRTSSSGEGEKMCGNMAKSEWTAVGTSSSKEGEKMVKGEWTAVGTSSSKEGEKMVKSEWTVVRTSSSKEGEMFGKKMAMNKLTATGTSSSKVVGDVGEVDLRAEMFIARFKDGMRLERQRSFGEYHDMLARGTSSSGEEEKVGWKMAKSEWEAVGTSSSSRAIGDLGEVDLRTEMFIARFKDRLRLERQRSFGEYHEMLARGV